MSKLRVLVIGSVNLDHVVKVARLPRAGETVGGGGLALHPGGKGANQALAARRLGAATQLIAAVGKDPTADIALAALKKAQVDLSGVRRVAAPTGAALISVDAKGANQITVAPGANSMLSPVHVPKRLPNTVLVLQLECPLAVVVEALIRGGKNPSILNPSPVMPLPQTVVDAAGLIVVNETERDALRARLAKRRGPVVVTEGAAGAALLLRGKVLARAKPPKVNVVDTTGAGDCFTGALAVALAEGMEAGHALRFACTAAALSTEAHGAQSAAPTRAAVNRKMRETK